MRDRYSPINYTNLAGKIDHGLLLGLTDDDHAQYWADTTIGTRAKNYTTTGTVTAGTLTDGTASLSGGVGTGYTLNTPIITGATIDMSDTSKLIKIQNNRGTPPAFTIYTGASGEEFFTIKTTTGSEEVNFGNTTEHATFNFYGNGAFNKPGTGLMSTGGAFTATGVITGSALITGSDIGIATHTDLFQLSLGAVTVDGDVTANSFNALHATPTSNRPFYAYEADNNAISGRIESAGTAAYSFSQWQSVSNGTALSMIAHGSNRTISRFGVTIASYGELLSSTGNGLLIGTNNTGDVILGTNSTAAIKIDGSTQATSIGDGGTTNYLKVSALGVATFNGTNDSSAVADEVSLGGYELSAGNRALAISQEAAVAVEVDETKFSHKMPVRINGTTYYIMLTAT